MSIMLYMDEHVPKNITRELKKRGIDVLTVQKDGKISISDSMLLDRATQLNRVVFTCDDDFLREATSRQRQGIEFTGVIYIHQTQLNIGKCIEDLELIATVCDPEEYKNHVEYLPLK